MRREVGVRYLEVGAYLGSTLACAAAVCINRVSRAVAVNDFNIVGSSAEDLAKRVLLCEARAVWDSPSYLAGGWLQLYLYDGPESERDHFDAVALKRSTHSSDD
jgi:hypothetical protein